LAAIKQLIGSRGVVSSIICTGGQLREAAMDELMRIAVGAAVITGGLTWSIRIGATAGVPVCFGLLAFIISR
jgi:hypothetical protein